VEIARRSPRTPGLVSLLQDAGTLEGNAVKGDWFVSPGSGSGELRGVRGEGGFTTDLGQPAAVTPDYWFEYSRASRVERR
jgi:Protein of unknown function (DUF3224)